MAIRGEQITMSDSPCLRCGACCAHTRVSFHQRETSQLGGSVPRSLTEPAGPGHCAMRRHDRRCIALEGPIGSARCTIYARRPEVCRDFEPSWKDGIHQPWCDEARALYDLPPLTPQDWEVSATTR